MLREGSELHRDICASSVALDVLVCCGRLSPALCHGNDSWSPVVWKPLVSITGFFPSLLPLKADDTYLQLKKDLEYLDLKVSDARGLACLGHSPFGECQLLCSQAQAKDSAGLIKSGSQMETAAV